MNRCFSPGCWCWNRLFCVDTRFPLGLRSRDWAGYSTTLILLKLKPRCHSLFGGFVVMFLVKHLFHRHFLFVWGHDFLKYSEVYCGLNPVFGDCWLLNAERSLLLSSIPKVLHHFHLGNVLWNIVTSSPRTFYSSGTLLQLSAESLASH